MKNLAVEFTLYYGEGFYTFSIWAFRWDWEWDVENGQICLGPFRITWDPPVVVEDLDIKHKI